MCSHNRSGKGGSGKGILGMLGGLGQVTSVIETPLRDKWPPGLGQQGSRCLGGDIRDPSAAIRCI